MKRNNRQPAKPDTPYQLKADYDMRAPPVKKILAGPHRWEEVKDDPAAHGLNFDYRVMDQAEGSDDGVFMPTCDAAQQFLYKTLGETQHWYGDLDGKYWGVHARHISILLESAEKDGLINEQDYEAAMNDRDARAGE